MRHRRLLTILYGAVLVFDAVVAYRLWLYRLWKVLQPIEGSVGKMQVATVRFTGLDFLVVATVVVAQLCLAYLLWRSWRQR